MRDGTSLSRFVRTAGRCSLLLAAAWSIGCAQAKHPSRPNALIICVDVLRADHVGAYGYAAGTTPAVDDLARSAVVFEHASSAAAWTKPSVPSYFTGRFPHQHGVYLGSREQGGRLVSDVLRAEERTLAELFDEAGYRTVAVVANPTVSAALGFSQGFDEYIGADDARAEAVREHFLGWLDRTNAELPFFGYVHFNDVHLPYDPPPSYRNDVGGVTPGVDFSSGSWRLLKRAVRNGSLRLSDTDRRALIELYDGELRYTDAQIGELLHEIGKRGLLENTLIVILSDHGEELLDHGGVDHGSSLHAELLHVPFILRFPAGERGGRRIKEPVSLVDVLPTLAAYFSFPAPPALAGRSLMPLITDGAPANGQRAIYSEGIHPSGYQQAVQLGAWKYVVTAPVTRAGASGSGEALRRRIAAGVRVEVKGMPSTGAFVAAKLQIKKEQDDARDEVTGTLEAIDADGGSLSVQGYRVRLARDSKYENHRKEPIERSALRPGTLVKVYGRALSVTEFSATKVGTRDPAAPKTPRLEGRISGDVRTIGDELVFRLAGRDVRVGRKVTVEIEGEAAPLEGAQTVDPWRAAMEAGSPLDEKLYAVDRDPREHGDLSAREPQTLDTMRAALAAFRRDTTTQPAPTRTLQTKDIESLRALGYLE